MVTLVHLHQCGKIVEWQLINENVKSVRKNDETQRRKINDELCNVNSISYISEIQPQCQQRNNEIYYHATAAFSSSTQVSPAIILITRGAPDGGMLQS